MGIALATDVLRDDYTVSEGFSNVIGGGLTIVFLGWFLYRIYEVLIEPRLNESPEELIARRAEAKEKAREAKQVWQKNRDLEVNGPPPHEAKFELIALKMYSVGLKRQGDKYETLSLREKSKNNGLEGWAYRYQKGQAKIELYERVVKDYEERYGAIDISIAVIARLQELDTFYDWFRRLSAEDGQFERETRRREEHVRYQEELKKAGAPAAARRIEGIEKSLNFLGSEDIHSNERSRLLKERAMWKSYCTE